MFGPAAEAHAAAQGHAALRAGLVAQHDLADLGDPADDDRELASGHVVARQARRERERARGHPCQPEAPVGQALRGAHGAVGGVDQGDHDIGQRRRAPVAVEGHAAADLAGAGGELHRLQGSALLA